MAHSKVPNADFAPSWLKFPNHESNGPAAKSIFGENANGSHNPFLQRHSSLDSYYQGRPRLLNSSPWTETLASQRAFSQDSKSGNEYVTAPRRQEEFPSLRGEQSGWLQTSKAAGAWEKPPTKAKPMGNYGENSNLERPERKEGRALYKLLVPTKSLKKMATLDASKLNCKLSDSAKAAGNRSASPRLPSPHAGLKAELNNKPHLKECLLSNDKPLLSSSLEDEQRLLKEMGWTETDDDEYEITEQDMADFHNKLEKTGVQCLRNGLCRLPQRDDHAGSLDEPLGTSDSDTDSD